MPPAHAARPKSTRLIRRSKHQAPCTHRDVPARASVPVAGTDIPSAHEHRWLSHQAKWERQHGTGDAQYFVNLP